MLFVKSTRDGGGSSSGSAGTSRLHSGAKGRLKGVGGSGGYNQNNGSGFGSAGSSGPKTNHSPQGNKYNNSSQAQGGEPNSNSDCKKCNCCCDKNQKNREKDRSKVICFRCDKPGHFASECPERLQKLQEGDFSERDDSDESVF